MGWQSDVWSAVHSVQLKWLAHNGHTVVVNMGLVVELFLDLGVLCSGPEVNWSATLVFLTTAEDVHTRHHLGAELSC